MRSCRCGSGTGTSAGCFPWVGFRQTAVPYTRASREAGESKYPFRKMVRLALDGFVGFLHGAAALRADAGLVMALASVSYGIVVLAMKLAGFPVSGPAMLHCW